MCIYVSYINFVLFQAKAIALAAKNGKLEFFEFPLYLRPDLGVLA